MVTAALLSPVAFRLVLPSQSSSKYKLTMCCPRRSNSLNTCRNKPDSPPLHAFQVKGQTQGPPKKNVTEKRLKQLHLKPRQLDIIMDTFGGRLQNGGLVFQQHFMIRSYELDPDGKVSIVALVNRLQESALNHLKSVGLHADGFGSTPEMHRRDLI
ncbi:acyl-[acyl-carrier-protein] hydrolase FATB2, chloroplastic-like [Castanea sativa]|uniref:acyl-[acyl-carrier-protein] hydrolase FATB2, chloroplastic-like n=1 Tax=Castanea sativa TaxID=21020 RepID=UPI003F64DA34